MSHHRRQAVVQIAVAIDNLEMAEQLAEEHGSGVGPYSLEIRSFLDGAKLALYQTNAGTWREAEETLTGTIARLSVLAGKLDQRRRELHAKVRQGRRIGESAPFARIVDQLVHARKALRSAILNLRLSKARTA